MSFGSPGAAARIWGKRLCAGLALTALTLNSGMAQTIPATSAAYATGQENTLVTLADGQLLGAEHNGVFSYLGVRYATAERFMPPKKVEPWKGVIPAVTYGESCPIARMKAVAGDELFNPHRYLPESEDCQFLNVWTPGVNDGKKRPVMVWLHGGGYTSGSAIEGVAYDGENLSRNGDVVIVSLNHRLNVLGFLDLSAYGEEYKHSGNVSMADIVVALEWVRDNIEALGGDPDNVTIFGQSGGGGKVRTLMGLPAADGLFHKAIVQSGAANPGVTVQKTSRRIAELTLENLGLTGDQVGQLTDLPYETLLTAANAAVSAAGKEEGLEEVRYAPTVDGDYLPAKPVDTAWVDQASDIPLLIGTVLNEQHTVTRFDPAELFADNKNNWTDEQAMAKLAERYGDKAEAVGKAFLAAYPDKKLGDAYFLDLSQRPGTRQNALLKAEQGGAPVYNYVFTWESPAMGGIGMAWHCSEIPHVFANISLVPQATGGGADAYALSEKMSMAWVNFARTGNPNHAGLPEWPQFDAENGAVMIFDNVSEVRYHHDTALLEAAGAI